MSGDGKERINECWRYFNPPKKLKAADFNNFIAKTKQQQEAVNLCRKYTLEHIQKGKGLFLYGAYGAGKTHLCVATVRNLLEQTPDNFGTNIRDSGIYFYGEQDYKGIKCSFFSTVDLLDNMRPGDELKKTIRRLVFPPGQS